MREVVQQPPPSGGDGNAERRVRWWEALALAAILLLGALLRFAYLHELEQSPYFSLPPIDPAFHDDWARALTGFYPADAVPGQYGPGQPADEPFMRPPGYPYFLAFVYLLTHGSYLGAYAAQMLLGLANVVLAFFLARRFFGQWPALLAGLGMSTYWALIYNEGELHAVVLLVFASLLFFLLLSRWDDTRGKRWAFGSGLVAALLVLTGPVALVFVPVAAAWMAALEWSRLRSRGFLVAPVLLLAGYALGVLPAYARNYAVSGYCTAVAPVGGINLFIGNNPKATGLFSWDYPEYGHNGPCYEFIEMRHVLAKKLGRPMSLRDLSDFFRDKAIAYIRDNPGAALRLTLRKALMFWGPVELRHNKAVELDRAASPLLRNLPGNFPVLMALCVLGCAIWAGEQWRARSRGGAAQHAAMPLLILGFVAIYSAMYTLFFVSSQFRAPLTPLLILFGAYGVYRLVAFALQRRYAATIGCVVTGVMLYALFRVPFVPNDDQGDRVFWHLDRGSNFVKLGQSDVAIAEYRATLESDPRCFAAHAGLAHELALCGRYDEARAACDSARATSPELVWVRFEVGMSFLRPLVEQVDAAFAAAPDIWPENSSADATTVADPHVAFGEQCLLRFAELCPEGRPAAYPVLAKTYVAQRRIADADAMYRLALETCPQCLTERKQLDALTRGATAAGSGS